MNILAFDTSTDIASVALWYNNQLIVETISGATSHAVCLLPLIERLMQSVAMSIQNIDAIAVGRGPGSFTGTRVACSIAKGLAWSLDTPIYALSSLAIITESISRHYNDRQPVLALLDARMQQVYWSFTTDHKSEINEHLDFIDAIHIPMQYKFHCAGTGWSVGAINQLLTDPAQLLSQIETTPDAAIMIKMVLSGRLIPISSEALLPVYLREHISQ